MKYYLLLYGYSFEDISVQSVTCFRWILLPMLPPPQRGERRSSTSEEIQ
jgi:hypothetical protein